MSAKTRRFERKIRRYNGGPAPAEHKVRATHRINGVLWWELEDGRVVPGMEGQNTWTMLGLLHALQGPPAQQGHCPTCQCPRER